VIAPLGIGGHAVDKPLCQAALFNSRHDFIDLTGVTGGGKVGEYFAIVSNIETYGQSILI
jgi:hypothetical protein